MRIFDLEKIKKSYFTEKTIEKAELVYSKSEINIKKLEIDKISDLHNLTATISYDSNEYSTSIGFKKKEEHFILLGDRICSCDEHAKKKINCEHMLSLVTYLNNYSYEELISDDKDLDYTSKDILKIQELYIGEKKKKYNKNMSFKLIPLFILKDEKIKLQSK